MEHIVKIAFWIVIFSVCLPSRCFPINTEDSNIEMMQTDVKCPEGSLFYTPSNVEPRCFTAALECFMTELNGTVTNECRDPNNYIPPAVLFLKHTIQERKCPDNDGLTESSKCSCENWNETSFNKFLEKMESLLQKINTYSQDKSEKSCSSSDN